MYAFALSAQNRNDEVKLSGAIGKLIDEDPSLRFEQDPELQQSLLWGQGEMHLRVALDRLRSKYHIGVDGRPPHTAYRETIRKSAQSHGRHKKQSGGHGQFGDVKIEIRPRQRGEGFEFIDKIVGGAVPRQYIPAVEAGAREFLQRGPLGFPVVDVSVTLFDGQFHSVDSSEIAFRMATALALREGLRAASRCCSSRSSRSRSRCRPTTPRGRSSWSARSAARSWATTPRTAGAAGTGSRRTSHRPRSTT